MRFRMILAVASVLVLSACANAGSGTHNGAVQYDEELGLGVPTAVTKTVEDVQFYPACGTEVLTFGGEQYYPYDPAHLDDFPDPAGEVTTASALLPGPPLGWARMSAPLPAVAEPGPGDGVGTLVIYDAGHAYWQSHNGDVSTWLTTTELRYSWIC